jgi:hypothetical protein
LLKSLIKTQRGQITGDAAASPVIWRILISDFNKETCELPDDDLKWIGTCWSISNVSNATILD